MAPHFIVADLEEEIRRISTPEQWAALQEFLAGSPMTLGDYVEAVVSAPFGVADQLGIDPLDMSAGVIAFVLRLSREPNPMLLEAR